MDPEIMELCNRYNEGLLNRREFLSTLAITAGGLAAANTLLPFLESNYALAATVPENDVRLHADQVEFPGDGGTMRAYLVENTNKNLNKAGVIVIHENRGLNPHIKDVARRVALEGFVAMAPDALSMQGGTPDDQDKARDMIGQLETGKNLNNFLAAARFLKSYVSVNQKIGCMGFCWGGGLANQLAVHSPEISAAVPYYGKQPAIGDVPKIKASLLLHYAGNDDRINAGIMEYETALAAAGVDYALYIYPGAQHAFNNDTNASRYHKEAADLAWERTVSFLKKKLQT